MARQGQAGRDRDNDAGARRCAFLARYCVVSRQRAAEEGRREENRRRRIQPREDTLRRVYVASRLDTPSFSVCLLLLLPPLPPSLLSLSLSVLLAFDRFRSLGNVRRVAAVPSASRCGRAISVSGFRVAVRCVRAHFSPVPVAVVVVRCAFTRACVFVRPAAMTKVTHNGAGSGHERCPAVSLAVEEVF